METHDAAWMMAHVAHEGCALSVEDVRAATEPVGPVAGDCINSYFAFESGVAGFLIRGNTPRVGARMDLAIEGSEDVIALRGDHALSASPTAACQPWISLDAGLAYQNLWTNALDWVLDGRLGGGQFFHGCDERIQFIRRRV